MQEKQKLREVIFSAVSWFMRENPKKHKLYNKRELVQGLLNEGVSKRKIAKIVKVDRNTLDRFIKRFL